MRIPTRRRIGMDPMTKQFAFLRAINVGGHTVTMEQLRGLFEGLGLKGVETFLASGNVVFDAKHGKSGTWNVGLNSSARFSGIRGQDLHPTETELGAIAHCTPFKESLIRSAGAFCVGFLSDPLQPGAGKSLMTLTSEIDKFYLHEREVYWLCKNKQSESKAQMPFSKEPPVRASRSAA